MSDPGFFGIPERRDTDCFGAFGRFEAVQQPSDVQAEIQTALADVFNCAFTVPVWKHEGYERCALCAPSLADLLVRSCFRFNFRHALLFAHLKSLLSMPIVFEGVMRAALEEAGRNTRFRTDLGTRFATILNEIIDEFREWEKRPDQGSPLRCVRLVACLMGRSGKDNLVSRLESLGLTQIKARVDEMATSLKKYAKDNKDVPALERRDFKCPWCGKSVGQETCKRVTGGGEVVFRSPYEGAIGRLVDFSSTHLLVLANFDPKPPQQNDPGFEADVCLRPLEMPIRMVLCAHRRGSVHQPADVVTEAMKQACGKQFSVYWVFGIKSIPERYQYYFHFLWSQLHSNRVENAEARFFDRHNLVTSS